MRHLATILLILGAFFLSIEVVGKERALRWETSLRQLAVKGEQTFGAVITYVATPWKKAPRTPWPSAVVRWLSLPFLLISVFSFYLLYRGFQTFGEIKTFAFVFGSWLASIGIMLLMGLTASLLDVIRSCQDILALLLVPILALAMIGLGLAGLAASLAAVLTSFPACLIFGFYIIIFLVSIGMTRLLAWRDALGLGNIFIIVGLPLTVIGIVLQWLAPGKK